MYYRILPVKSHGYYKFQVEIGAVTKILISKLHVKIWFSTLYYAMTIRVWRVSEVQLLTGKICTLLYELHIYLLVACMILQTVKIANGYEIQYT